MIVKQSQQNTINVSFSNFNPTIKKNGLNALSLYLHNIGVPNTRSEDGGIILTSAMHASQYEKVEAFIRGAKQGVFFR